MSHFVVMVIGGNIERQLAKYNEQERVEPYPEPVEHEQLKRMLDYYKKEGNGREQVAALAAQFDKNGRVDKKLFPALARLYMDWDGAELKATKDGYVRMSTYNPDSKWDWYLIGGRWTGYFKMKKGKTGSLGGTADQCVKGDIDIEGMREEAAKRATKNYDKMMEATKGEKWTSWDDMRAKHGGDVDKAREEYWKQPAVAACQKAGIAAWGGPDAFLCDKEKYVQRARDAALLPYAVVKDGKWFEKGKMGWWGMSRDEMSKDEWAKKFAELFDPLPANTKLTAVDCHI